MTPPPLLLRALPWLGVAVGALAAAPLRLASGVDTDSLAWLSARAAGPLGAMWLGAPLWGSALAGLALAALVAARAPLAAGARVAAVTAVACVAPGLVGLHLLALAGVALLAASSRSWERGLGALAVAAAGLTLPLEHAVLAVALGAAGTVAQRLERAPAWATWAAVGGVLALGPVVSWGGEAVAVGGRLLPLPAQLFVAAGLTPSLGWTGCAAGPLLALALWPSPRGERAVTALSAVAVVATVVVGLAWPSSATAPLPPSASRTVLALDGPVLILPTPPPGGRPPPELRRWASRGVAVVQADTASASPLYAEPLVPLAWTASQGGDAWALPPDEPGSHLAGLGVRWVVVVRPWLTVPGARALDAVLHRTLGLPQRDLASGLDLYAVPPGDGAPPAATVARRPTDPDLPAGWRSAADALGATTP